MLFTLAFASAPYLKYLTLPHNIARRTVLQKVRRCTHMVLRQLVNIGFQVLFHSPPGVLFTFPSLYCFSIGHQVVFRLGGWSLLLPARFHVSRGTLDTAVCLRISRTGLSPSLAGFPNTIPLSFNNNLRSPQPQNTEVLWFGLFPFRSPLL